jgi:hypothetical protein
MYPKSLITTHNLLILILKGRREERGRRKDEGGIAWSCTRHPAQDTMRPAKMERRAASHQPSQKGKGAKTVDTPTRERTPRNPATGRMGLMT